ncbi:glycosyl hydrolase family 43 [Alginatibacterium sediminis]|uniref:Glycosyl hydrolase family 43 n=1 Tax=Alginatibacterium sediminis TaxID=2164068 RepID=A0A420EBC5_9ALTE|nr:glycoside hydrolase family protein [Alginatibacterium sediminis]RKF17954.1 glycosyl hydrolase family 43 [Alginatibacterium sediminis]
MSERSLLASNQSSLFSNLQSKGRALESPDHHIWGASPILDEQGKVHLFYSRWTNRASHYGWVLCCEVAHSVSNSPEGPFKFVNVALTTDGDDSWDGWSIHNPTIHKTDDGYVMFYMGSCGKELGISRNELIQLSIDDKEKFWPYFHALVATKAVGGAVSKSLDGPWEKIGTIALVAPGIQGQWDDFVTSNPAYLHHPNGEHWLYYKAWNKKSAEFNNGNRQYGLAIAQKIEGPYIKVDSNPLIDFSHLGPSVQCEDAYVFMLGNRFHMLTRDMGYFDNQVGLHFQSVDGLDWGLPKIAFRKASEHMGNIDYESNFDRQGVLERPQVLMIDQKPAYLYCCCVGGHYHTSSSVILKIGD